MGWDVLGQLRKNRKLEGGEGNQGDEAGSLPCPPVDPFLHVSEYFILSLL